MNTQSAAAALGKPIRGPSAFDGDVRRFAHLTVALAVTDFKLKFFGSVLGYLWQLMRPLLLFGVLFVVFTQFVRIGSGVPHYAVILLTGMVLFQFVADATSTAVLSVVQRENLIRKIQFPRLAIPGASVLTSIFNLLLNLIAVFVFYLATGVDPRPSWLLLVPLLLILVVYVAGISMILSALYVRFRDLKPIWEVLLQVMFYGTPILYAIETVPNATLQHLLMLNPLAVILEQVRHWMIDPNAPTAAAAAGGGVRLLIPAAIVAGAFGLGVWIFNRQAPVIAEEL